MSDPIEKSEDTKVSDDPKPQTVTPKEEEDHDDAPDLDGNHHSDPKKDGFNADYVKRLREEAKAHRMEAKAAKARAAELQNKSAELDEQLKKAKEKMESLGKASFEKANSINNAVEKRFINYEIDKACKEHGIVDRDAFRLADMSKVKLSDEGEVIGLKEVIEELKKSKPYVFQKASSAKPGAKAPVSVSTGQDVPTYKDEAEFNKAKEKYLNSLR